MQVQARLNNFRRSAQKVRESSSIIKGLKVADAINQLDYSKKGDAEVLKKLLKSAVANAENNNNLDKDNLFVSNVIAEEGKTMKRWRARAYGRAAQILKRTCNIVISLDEIEEGKKTTAKKGKKEDTPKETKEEVKDKGEKKEGEEEKDEKKTSAAIDKGPQKAMPKGGAGAAKKVYRRKSF